MKSKLLVIIITAIATGIVILTIGYFILGLNTKPKTILSLDSPDRAYTAYVVENPALDPPCQSLYIGKNGSNEFRLVANLPEDIEICDSIYWSPDGITAIFTTNWHIYITHIEGFNTKKISINPDWWKRMEKGTYRSSDRHVQIERLTFVNSDTIRYKTNLMDAPGIICINNL
jgi:hypothetical protein